MMDYLADGPAPGTIGRVELRVVEPADTFPEDGGRRLEIVEKAPAVFGADRFRALEFSDRIGEIHGAILSAQRPYFAG